MDSTFTRCFQRSLSDLSQSFFLWAIPFSLLCLFGPGSWAADFNIIAVVMFGMLFAVMAAVVSTYIQDFIARDIKWQREIKSVVINTQDVPDTFWICTVTVQVVHEDDWARRVEQVTLAIENLRGELIRTLHSETKDSMYTFYRLLTKPDAFQSLSIEEALGKQLDVCLCKLSDIRDSVTDTLKQRLIQSCMEIDADIIGPRGSGKFCEVAVMDPILSDSKMLNQLKDTSIGLKEAAEKEGSEVVIQLIIKLFETMFKEGISPEDAPAMIEKLKGMAAGNLGKPYELTGRQRSASLGPLVVTPDRFAADFIRKVGRDHQIGEPGLRQAIEDYMTASRFVLVLDDNELTPLQTANEFIAWIADCNKDVRISEQTVNEFIIRARIQIWEH